jgi:hypothetical protein
MIRWLRRHWLLGSLALGGLAGVGLLCLRLRGPHRSYRVDISSVSAVQGPLLVGAARRDITPRLEAYDTWTDADGNGLYEPGEGDTCQDRNDNDRCDLVWLAGFEPRRPAKGIGDPLWARAIAFRHGSVTLVVVSIDGVGLTHERFIRVRRSIEQETADITHVVFSSTHTHSAPDTMNLWSRYPLLPGLSEFDQAYLDRVLAETKLAVLEAVAHLNPAEVVYASTALPIEGYVRDSRPPRVFDPTLCAVRFLELGTEETIATLVSWSSHPEAVGSKNNLISSDYPHYWRMGVEQGLPDPHGAPGLGGICVFFGGSVGGLLTPLGVEVPDRDGVHRHAEDGVAKARALGENLALHTLALLAGPEARRMRSRRIAIVARSVFLPVSGPFRWPILLGLIHPGWFGGKIRSEIDALRVGEIEILTIPGELYPEIAMGGVEAPAGADYPGPPRELPPLRSRMRGEVEMLFGLANDEVGYIIPRTQWDTRPPYTYGRSQAPYGEEMSGGPGVAEAVHREALVTLDRLHALLGETP